MKSFIPVVNLGGHFWSDDRAVWDAIHPGWWSLLDRVFGGEAVFDDFDRPYAIVNVPRRGPKNEDPGLAGTLDFVPGEVQVIFNTTWGAPVDLMPPGSITEDMTRRMTDWFNSHRGMAGGTKSDSRREWYGCGARIHERITDATSFQDAMTRIKGLERRLLQEDAEARVKFTADLGVSLHHIWHRSVV